MHYTQCYNPLLLFVSLCILCTTTSSTSLHTTNTNTDNDEQLLKLPKAPMPAISLEHLDPTLPPVLPAGQTPRCSVVAFHHSFANTVGAPPTSVNYTQPADCPFPWSRIILELHITVSDLQQGRVAAVWIDGSEIIRTSTPRPMAPGAFWQVHKDVTRYAALLRRLSTGGVISMMLENTNDVLPGVFTANVTLHFYRGPVEEMEFSTHPTIKRLYREPAHLVLPVSQPDFNSSSGHWFRINNDGDVATAPIALPRNAYRAVLEFFVSYHGDEESWYLNPLRSLYHDDEGTLEAPRANGAFRRVLASIDGRFAGARIPFPVLYPTTINPYFWSPVAAIGAFDMPSYELDFTPFLATLLDGRVHEIGLAIQDAQQYWLVSANLHVWVDEWSDVVLAGETQYFSPPIQMNRNAEWRERDGQSEIEAGALMHFAGWVSSSKGNFTTQVRLKLKLKSQVEVQNRGATEQVELIIKERLMVAILKGNQVLSRVQLLVESPMQLQATSVIAGGKTVMKRSRLYHQLVEMQTLNEGQLMTTSTLTDRQDTEGTVLMNGAMPMWGSGSTRSAYRYKDDRTCYLRNVNTVGGLVMLDTKTSSCSAIDHASN